MPKDSCYILAPDMRLPNGNFTALFVRAGDPVHRPTSIDCGKDLEIAKDRVAMLNRRINVSNDDIRAILEFSGNAGKTPVDPIRTLSRAASELRTLSSVLDKSVARETLILEIERAIGAAGSWLVSERHREGEKLKAACGDQHPEFRVADWIGEVHCGKTKTGYWEWAAEKVEAAALDTDADMAPRPR